MWINLFTSFCKLTVPVAAANVDSNRKIMVWVAIALIPPPPTPTPPLRLYITHNFASFIPIFDKGPPR